MIALQPVRRHHHARRQPLRLHPSQGEPRCLLEQFAQHVVTHKVAWFTLVCAAVTAFFAVAPYFLPGLRR